MTDVGERYRMELSNGALIHFPTERTSTADASVSLTRMQLMRLLATGATDGVTIEGDDAVLAKLQGVTDRPDPNFDSRHLRQEEL